MHKDKPASLGHLLFLFLDWILFEHLEQKDNNHSNTTKKQVC